MIYDVLIIHRQSEIPLYHQVVGDASKLPFMGLDASIFAQLAMTVVLALKQAGALDRLIVSDVKVALLLYEDLLFALITSQDHDEFEIQNALERLSSLFLQSYTKEVITQYQHQALSFHAFDVSSIFRNGRVVISDSNILMKSMIQRLANMVQVATRLEQDASMLAQKPSVDGTIVLSITAMQQELDRKLQMLKQQMGQLPM
ncbi:MAG: hypothetical protein ACFFCO_11860 [Promethearchaeota archaeon]